MQQHSSDIVNLQLQAFRSGDILGFNYFFNQHYAALCYFANNLLQDQPAAEEITDDAFVKLWQRHILYNSSTAIKAFLYSTVRNAAIDVIRRKKTQASLQHEFQSQSETTAPFILQQIIRAETLAQIYAAFDILPIKCREVFTRLYIDGKTYEEIAEELELSVNSVRNHKMRAIALLKGQLSNFIIILISACFYI